MDQILALLSGMGPWGVLVGIVLVIVVQRLGLKLPKLPSLPKAPDTPTGPDQTPAPLRDALLKLVMDLLMRRATRENRSVEMVAMDLLGREVSIESKAVEANAK